MKPIPYWERMMYAKETECTVYPDHGSTLDSRSCPVLLQSTCLLCSEGFASNQLLERLGLPFTRRSRVRFEMRRIKPLRHRSQSEHSGGCALWLRCHAVLCRRHRKGWYDEEIRTCCAVCPYDKGVRDGTITITVD